MGSTSATPASKKQVGCYSLLKERRPLGGAHGLCRLAHRYKRVAEMCRAMGDYLHGLLEQRTSRSPCLVCCAAGGKELLVPLYHSGRVVDAAVFIHRSPRKDREHLRNLSVHLGIPQQEVDAAWRSLPSFSPAAAERVVARLKSSRFLQERGFPTPVEFDEDGVRNLAAAYDEPLGPEGGLRFYDMDIRVFGMINSLRALTGIRAVDVVYFAQGARTSIVRFFQRDLGPVLPLRPPIYGLRVPKRIGDDLQRYVRRHERLPCPREPQAGDTIAEAVLGLPRRHGGRTPSTYTFSLSTQRNARGSCPGFGAAADIALVNNRPRRAEIARACLAAGSDWADATAVHELLRRLPPSNRPEWDEFRMLVSQFATFLGDARIPRRRDKWCRFMGRLDDLICYHDLEEAVLAKSPVVKETQESLKWLRGQADRATLDSRAGHKCLRRVREAAVGRR